MKIKRNYLWIYFVLIPFFPLRGFFECSLLYKHIMTGWLLVSIIVIIVQIITRRIFSVSKKCFVIYNNELETLAYFLVMLLISIAKKGELGEGLQKMIAVPFLCLLIQIYGKKINLIADVLANIILFNVAINCTILFPPVFRKLTGINTQLINSIGHVQTSAQIGLLGLFLAFFLKDCSNIRRNNLLIIFSILTMIISLTLVSQVVLVFLFAAYIFCGIGMKVTQNIKMSAIYVLMIAINIIVLIVVVKFRIDFGARCGIYTVALEQFFKQPLFGYGVEGIKIIPEWMQFDSSAKGFNYAHNEVLQLLLDGGLFLFMANLKLGIGRLRAVDSYAVPKEKYVFLIILIAFGTVGFAESITEYNYFWAFLFLLEGGENKCIGIQEK